MIKFIALALAVIAAAPVSAPAKQPPVKPQLESQLVAATGRAVLKMLLDDKVAARAECTAGKKLLTAKTPPYLAALGEECFAVAADASAPGSESPKCPYYLRAIDIWRATPPPFDDDEDAILRRAGKLRDWKFFAGQQCKAPAGEPRPDMGPIDSIPRGARLQTPEGLSYLIPEDWTVAKFDDVAGSATLHNEDDEVDMHIARAGATPKIAYTDQTALPSGGKLDWTYVKFVPKAGMPKTDATDSYRSKTGLDVLYARVLREGGVVELAVLPSADAGEGTSIDKDDALEALMAVADSVTIEGNRTCLGNCGPGTIIAPPE